MIYSGSYDIQLVLFSIMVGIITLFASLSIVNEMKSLDKRERVKWIIGGSLIFGLGIWTMHFVGMLGYDAHMIVTYHAGKTATSLLLAVLGGSFAFLASSFSKKLQSLSAILMGLTLMGMHFMGMKSMLMKASISYDLLFGVSSTIMAIFVSFWIINIFNNIIKNQSNQLGLLSHSTFLGLAIASVHYTAMESVLLKGEPSTNLVHKITYFDIFSNPISSDILAYLLSIAVLFITGTIILLVFVDKKQVQQLQRVTEAQYKSLFEHNPNIVFKVQNNGLITNVNPKGLEISKFKRDDIISKYIFSFFKEEDRQLIESRFQHFEEEHKDFEATIRNGKGKWIPLIVTFVPIKIGEKMVGAFVVASDNTEIIESKNRIKKAQRDLFNTIRKQQGLTYKFIKVGESYIHTLCEGQLLYKLGLSPSVILGKEVHEFFPKEEIEKRLDVYRTAWNGEITSYEASVNGIDYFVTLSPVIEDGKVKEVIGSGIDITPLKKAERFYKQQEKWYRSILSEMSEGVMLYGDDDHITPLNDNVHKMFGITKEKLQGQTIFNNSIEFIREDGSPLNIDNYPIHTSLKTGETVTGEIIGVKQKERTIWLSVNSKILESFEQKENQKVLFTMSDITSQKENEINLKEHSC